jgi:hypothetical protein
MEVYIEDSFTLKKGNAFVFYYQSFKIAASGLKIS